LKKEVNDLAKSKYLENADLSLKTANELMQSPLKPHVWIIVISYYSSCSTSSSLLSR